MNDIPVTILLMLLAFMGCLVGGPNNIITSAVAADLADDPSIKGNNKVHYIRPFVQCVASHNSISNISSLLLSIFTQALGTVTGIINGSGSVTAALGQLAIPILYEMGKVDNVGYRYVWFFLIVCTAVGTSLLSPRIYKELYPGSTLLNSATRSGYQAITGTDKA